MKRVLLRLAVVLSVGGLLPAALLLLCAGPLKTSAQTTVRYVAPNGNCGSNAPCYAQLQAAVDAASDGDEVRVAAGTYTGVGSRNGSSQHLYLDKSLVLRGGYHPQTWQQDPALNPSILDAQGLGRVLTVAGAVSPVVDGFHMINGSAPDGGAVYIDAASAVLSRNEIYDNAAEGSGGGVYVSDGAAILTGNHIHDNTTGPTGHGGGLVLLNSPAEVTDNVIEGNAAHVGGGVELYSTLGASGATLSGNTIRDNLAFELQQGGYVFDGAGGGIDISGSLPDTLRDNVISGNIGGWGGGVHAYGASPVLIGNTIRENEASVHGGGIYTQNGQPRIESNNILTNTASDWGGGLALLANAIAVRDNTFQGNTSGWRGGGLLCQNAVQFDANRFLGNTAADQGGGVFQLGGVGARYENSVFVGNQAPEGGALYVWGATAGFTHSTFAGNTGSGGHPVFIDKYPGLIAPEQPTTRTSVVTFTNSIVSGQPLGFFTTAENSLTIDGVLWHDTPAHVEATGAALTVLNEHTGDPVFQADGYHLRPGSAARDKALSVLDHDVDGQARDGAGPNDLGADEYAPAVRIDPPEGGVLTYADPQGAVTITLDVPPGAVDEALALMFSALPPLPDEVLTGPLSDYIVIGPPFRLDPFQLNPGPWGDRHDPPLGPPGPPPVFGYPAELTLEYDVETLRQFRESMDRLELQLLAILDGELSKPPQNPACGEVQHDTALRTLEVPICDTGIVTQAAGAAAGLQVQLLAEDPEAQPGVFVFVVPKPRVYLPIVLR